MSEKKSTKVQEQLQSLDNANNVLYALFLNGLQNVSKMSLDQISAIAMNCHNRKFLRLESELNIIKEYLNQYLSRDPNFSTSLLVNQVNTTWMLIRLLRNHVNKKDVPIDPKRLFGTKKKEYVDLPDVTFQPMGMQLWETKDRQMSGVTAYLYDVDKVTDHEFYQVTNARPKMYLKGSIENIPTNASGYSVSRLASQPHVFKKGKVMVPLSLSEDGDNDQKISLSKDLVIDHVQSSYHTDHKFDSWHFDAIRIRNWKQLASRISRQAVTPFASGFSRSQYFILKYAELKIGKLDEVRNVQYFDLLDEEKYRITIEIENRNFYMALITNLRNWCGKSSAEMFGRIYVRGNRLLVEPISMLSSPLRIFNLMGGRY